MTAVVALALVGAALLAGQGTPGPAPAQDPEPEAAQQTECSVCTARHQSLQRLQQVRRVQSEATAPAAAPLAPPPAAQD
ncbi:MAG: hypothetical protein EP307_01395 [Rhodobacteraceae bacterium]|nr:MAG: hypothetical protein EP307_01395 [Paracoccaceae bacterium]